MTMRGRIVRRAGGFALAAGLLVAAPVVADDAGVRRRIQARLDKTDLAEHGQVQVEVANGVAVLSGFTDTVAARREAEKAARKETKAVESRIRVVSAARPDGDLRESVAGAVLRSVHYGVFDSVGVGVEDGVVTLVGSVLRPWHRSDIEQRVARVPGVRDIRNEIRVQPVSSFDDRLRRQLHREIYGGLLRQHAESASPPVRIVVENGRVTLSGVVNSRVERVMLESIARGTMAFRVSNEVQVESEIEKEPRRTTARES
jgi:hyperosmotically inducible protein